MLDAAQSDPAALVHPIPGAPPITSSFIGREIEIERLRALLDQPDVRLITLTGPGGVGKTRLALEAATGIRPSGTRDVQFLALASISDPDLVGPAIGQVAGLTGVTVDSLPDRLAASLSDRRLLLVLDNFEQLLPAGPLLSSILRTCPTLQLLVTSRAPLHLTLEVEVPVAPLELPHPGSSHDRVAETPAVQLLLSRARLQNTELSEEETLAAAAICRKLDGLPLAIELAAAKTRVFSLSELLNRLDRRLPILTDGPRDVPKRLQSMRDAIGWSYELLTGEEQTLFRTLSIFEGGFSLSAAEAICPDRWNVSPTDGLAKLIDQSLVIRVSGEGGKNRFGMLETIREFGLEQLNVTGEEAMARDRHLTWFIESLGSPGPEVWIDQRAGRDIALPDDEHNLRAALTWALTKGEAVRAAQIAWGLLPFWRSNGFFHEAAASLDRVVDSLGPFDPVLSAGMKYREADLRMHIGDLSRATELWSSALGEYRETGTPAGVRASLNGLVLATRWTNHQAAIEMISEAATISLEMDDAVLYAADLRQRAMLHLLSGDLTPADDDLANCLPLLRQTYSKHSSLAFALGTAGWLAGLRDEPESAEQLAGEALTMSIDLHIPECEVYARRILGHVAFQEKQFQVALDYFRAGFEIVYRSAMHMWEGFCLVEFAHVAASQGNLIQAAWLYGAADASWKQLGIPTPARAIAGWSGPMTIDPEVLADSQIQAAYVAGQRLSGAEAFAEAMSVRLDAKFADRSASVLSSREHEVLLRIATGETNREIAENLFVSKRTVDSHVHSILAKLGVDSRRDAVATARQQGMFES